MEIQQLRHLLAAVQFGNLVKAAEESHISQSGLSRSIKSLETRLGVPLLLRRAKGVEPTVYGLSLLKRATVIINEVARSIREIRAIEQATVGELTLGITPNYSHHLLPEIVADVVEAQHGARLTIVVASFMELVGKLKIGDIDFAFGLLGAIEPTPDLQFEVFGESHSRVIARAGHPLIAGRTLSIGELSHGRWAMLNGEGFQRNFVNFFYVRGENIPVQALKTDSIALLKRVVQHSDLLTVLPLDTVATELQQGSLATVECETPAEFARVGFIYRSESLVTPQMQQLADRIRARLHGD